MDFKISVCLELEYRKIPEYFLTLTMML